MIAFLIEMVPKRITYVTFDIKGHYELVKSIVYCMVKSVKVKSDIHDNKGEESNEVHEEYEE